MKQNQSDFQSKHAEKSIATGIRKSLKKPTGSLAWITYAFIRILFAFMQLVPIDRALQSAEYLAEGWCLLTKRHYNRAKEHLRTAYTVDGNCKYSESELHELTMKCMTHWTKFAIELVVAPKLMSESNWTRYITPVNFEGALKELTSNRGAILVTGHYGHFEMAGYMLGALGFDVTALMRPLDNYYLNKFVVKSRAKHGLKLLDKKGATMKAKSIMENGGTIAFIADQDAGRKGMFVDFFGQPASTYKSIGLLAMSFECPVIVGYSRRVGDGFNYEVGVQKIIYPSDWEHEDKPLQYITQQYTTAMEEFINEEPSQYLWLHRRWKSKPGMKRKKK